MKRIDKRHEEWLKDALSRHERLTVAVVALLEGVLKKKNIEYLSVVGRTKRFASALDKIGRKKYARPEAQLTDLSGIRIVTYLQDQVVEIIQEIRELFEIDEDNSMDRSELLGNDRLGYRSTHFVCTLGEVRDTLPEYESLGELMFEIQVRTVLQHAWAQIAHDRTFKFQTALPIKLERKLNLYSGLLEIADGGFAEIAKEIDQYGVSVSGASAAELNEIEVDSISVSRFLSETKRKHRLKTRSSSGQQLALAIEELKLFGVKNIGELERLVATKPIEIERRTSSATDIGFLRNLMLYEDMEKYFLIWKRPWWSGIDVETVDMLKNKYGTDKVDSILERHEIVIEDEQEDFDTPE